MPDEHPAPLKRGDDSRRNWVTINQLNALLQPALSDVRRLSSAVADLRLRPAYKEGGGEAGTIRKYTLLTMEDDYVVAQDDTGATFNIAKPWRLRRTPFDGQSFTRTDAAGVTYTVTYVYSSPTARAAIIGSTTELQTVVPSYDLLSDIIFATGCSNGTGVIDAPSLQDINADARAWARRRS